MTPSTKQQLTDILTRKERPWDRVKDALAFIESCEVSEEPKGNRTDSQHRALFLWFGQIEHEAENQGVTWDMVIKHTHQLRITKETLHGMCKSLQQSLWNTTSTKELKKQGNIDIIIDHFVDVLGKAGLEVPSFPSREKESLLQSLEIVNSLDYPDSIEEPLI